MTQPTKKKYHTLIVWLRNDLRLRDNEALWQAAQDAEYILPLYCLDDRQWRITPYGFEKTGIFRIQFLLECLRDLQFAFRDIGADLHIRHGKPEEIVFALAKYYQADAVYCQQEIATEEVAAEMALERNLDTIDVPMYYFWGSTMYHFDDLPLSISELPDSFADFRLMITQKATVRPPLPAPTSLQLPENLPTTPVPSVSELGFSPVPTDKRAVITFKGGETAALLRLKHYFWASRLLEHHKVNRNNLMEADSSSKFSPWLAHGCLSPRTIHAELQQYEAQIEHNESTYYFFSELIWRDYFRFLAMKSGNDLFAHAGIRQAEAAGNPKKKVEFTHWCAGTTGIPFIDAFMRELNLTGFISDRGRKNVASFLVHDLGVDWRMGAAYFEAKLVDYDVYSNYGNWNYIANTSNDPKSNRYFHPILQAKRYDPQGIYTKYWCEELRAIPATRLHEPYLLQPVEQQYLRVFIGKDYPKPCFDWKNWHTLAQNNPNKKK